VVLGVRGGAFGLVEGKQDIRGNDCSDDGHDFIIIIHHFQL